MPPWGAGSKPKAKTVPWETPNRFGGPPGTGGPSRIIPQPRPAPIPRRPVPLPGGGGITPRPPQGEFQIVRPDADEYAARVAAAAAARPSPQIGPGGAQLHVDRFGRAQGLDEGYNPHDLGGGRSDLVYYPHFDKPTISREPYRPQPGGPSVEYLGASGGPPGTGASKPAPTTTAPPFLGAGPPTYTPPPTSVTPGGPPSTYASAPAPATTAPPFLGAGPPTLTPPTTAPPFLGAGIPTPAPKPAPLWGSGAAGTGRVPGGYGMDDIQAAVKPSPSAPMIPGPMAQPPGSAFGTGVKGTGRVPGGFEVVPDGGLGAGSKPPPAVSSGRVPGGFEVIPGGGLGPGSVVPDNLIPDFGSGAPGTGRVPGGLEVVPGGGLGPGSVRPFDPGDLLSGMPGMGRTPGGFEVIPGGGLGPGSLVPSPSNPIPDFGSGEPGTGRVPGGLEVIPGGGLGPGSKPPPEPDPIWGSGEPGTGRVPGGFEVIPGGGLGPGSKPPEGYTPPGGGGGDTYVPPAGGDGGGYTPPAPVGGDGPGAPAPIIRPDEGTISPFSGVGGDAAELKRKLAYLGFAEGELDQMSEDQLYDMGLKYDALWRALPGRFNSRGMLDSGLYRRGADMLADRQLEEGNRQTRLIDSAANRLAMTEWGAESDYALGGLSGLQGRVQSLVDALADLNNPVGAAVGGGPVMTPGGYQYRPQGVR